MTTSEVQRIFTENMSPILSVGDKSETKTISSPAFPYRPLTFSFERNCLNMKFQHNSQLVLKLEVFSFKIFSRHFFWESAIIVMTFRQCFFRYTWSGQNSSKKIFYKILRHYNVVPVGKWIKNVFPRNIQYRAKLKDPPFSFLAVCDFLSKKIPQRVSIFLEFCDRLDVEKSQRIPPLFFRHCETFFTKGTLFIFFWWFATEWIKKSKAPPWRANSVQLLDFWVFRVLSNSIL